MAAPVCCSGRAERSVSDGRDRRRFYTQTIAELADAIGVPIVAFYLPPEDDGYGKRYLWQAGADGQRDMADLMQITLHDIEDDSEIRDEYRDRFRAAAMF